MRELPSPKKGIGRANCAKGWGRHKTQVSGGASFFLQKMQQNNEWCAILIGYKTTHKKKSLLPGFSSTQTPHDASHSVAMRQKKTHQFINNVTLIFSMKLLHTKYYHYFVLLLLYWCYIYLIGMLVVKKKKKKKESRWLFASKRQATMCCTYAVIIKKVCYFVPLVFILFYYYYYYYAVVIVLNRFVGNIKKKRKKKKRDNKPVCFERRSDDALHMSCNNKKCLSFRFNFVLYLCW